MGEIIHVQNARASGQPFRVSEMTQLAKACVGSGFYKDIRDVNKALVKMMAGHELGFGPSASLTGIYIVKEKVSLSSNLIAALIKRSPYYDYKVNTHTDEKCEIEFYEKLEGGKKTLLGISSFSMEDAKKAGIISNATWKSYPRNMLFARALTNGQKWHCPDVTAGMPIYTPEELGVQEDQDGNLIENAQVEVHNPEERKILLDKLKVLIERTGVDLPKMLAHYAVHDVGMMGTTTLKAAIRLLEDRIEAHKETESTPPEPGPEPEKGK